jgi:hypothetical protein
MIGELVRTWTDDRTIMGEFGLTNAVHLKYKGRVVCCLVSGRKETVFHRTICHHSRPLFRPALSYCSPSLRRQEIPSSVIDRCLPVLRGLRAGVVVADQVHRC